MKFKRFWRWICDAADMMLFFLLAFLSILFDDEGKTRIPLATIILDIAIIIILIKVLSMR